VVPDPRKKNCFKKSNISHPGSHLIFKVNRESPIHAPPQLERTAKEMTDRVTQLESRIQQLEMENKWLKNLIVEKNGGKSGEELLMPRSILSGSKDGIGTVGGSVKNEN